MSNRPNIVLLSCHDLGRHPHCNGVMGLTHAGFKRDLHGSETHLAQHLQSAGYHTALIGVQHETRRDMGELGFAERVHAQPEHKAKFEQPCHAHADKAVEL